MQERSLEAGEAPQKLLVHGAVENAGLARRQCFYGERRRHADLHVIRSRAQLAPENGASHASGAPERQAPGHATR
jgi:hypothetical protein